jgi:hypothetical protein
LSAAGRARRLSHVVLCGGTAQLPGLDKRLEHELQNLQRLWNEEVQSQESGAEADGTQLHRMDAGSWRVHAAATGDAATFVGAKVVAGCSTFEQGWCSARCRGDGALRAVDAPARDGEEDEEGDGLRPDGRMLLPARATALTFVASAVATVTLLIALGAGGLMAQRS